MLSKYSDYMTGDVVTIDGGEWLMGGEFNSIAALPKAQFDNVKNALASMKR